MKIKKTASDILDKAILMRKSFNSAIIVAGGSGLRAGEGIPKQHRRIAGKHVIARTVDAFEKCAFINEIIIVCRAGEEKLYEKYAAKYGWMKVTSIVPGGDDRFASVIEGFKAISDKSGYVYIHDGARCLVTPDIIQAVGHQACISGAAVAACRPVDSCKTERDGGLKNLDREKTWLVQTPQVFKTELYRAAAYTALKDRIAVTDDASVAEHAGFKVVPVDCGRENIKITSPLDFVLAEAIIAEREKSNV